MRHIHAPLILLTALACNEGRLEFEVDEGSLSDDETGSEATEGGEGTDPDDGDDTEGTEGTDDAGFQWSGDYEGEQSLGLAAPNGDWVDLCWGSASWEVTDGGDLQGSGDCEMQRGPARGEFMLFDYEGTVDADGMVWGEVVLTRSWSDASDVLELEAWIAQEGGERWVEAWMTGTIQTRDGDTPVEGWAWGGS